ncbi:class I SAM-dependent methyltransferase [Janthinobacterium lividum]|uniref:class I SAM-dependent methyltransferase n=1 Tax=Janthinobacterium lividum TaxID=29581 RepID=UPI0015954D07|nr:class I SAM-dependent methyltransferase [Janthinobacterium lividum]QKY12025.1 class I SAM-dependent methyltransferase [Janthinobacterium lividum]
MKMAGSTTVNFDFLMEFRSKIGPNYGSEDLCMLLYSIVKREKPAVVVELGTGLGVTTAWIAAAMKENGFGKIYSVDNGEHYAPASKPWWKTQFRNRLEPLVAIPDYARFIDSVFAHANVAEHVKFIYGDIDLENLGWLDSVMKADSPDASAPSVPLIDIVFADYNHSPTNTAKIIASFLPCMTPVSSIFIDSASTHYPSYLMLERIVQLFDQGRVPVQMLDHLRQAESREKLSKVVAASNFKLMHLVEKQNRAQNSTAWLRIEPTSLLPALAIHMH